MIASGQPTLYWPTVFEGDLPQQIVLAMVTTASLNGDLTLNPFNFRHFNLSKCQIVAGGITYPSGGYETDFKNGLYMKMLHDFYINTGHVGNSGGFVNYDNFATGFCLPTWNFNPDRNMSLSEINGSVDIDLHFAKSLTESVTVIALGFNEEQMTIDENRDMLTATRGFERNRSQNKT